MKKIAILIIDIYHLFFSPLIKNILGVSKICRQIPTCSAYARSAILKHGVIKGGHLSVLRLISCNPWTNKISKAEPKNFLIFNI